MRLLVAEDDTSVCEMLQLFFQKEHYNTTFVHDGWVAEQRLLEESWDFVILDWMLPGKDGISLCKQVRTITPTPIILLTARDQEKDRILGLESGADDYVVKPFSPMELIARIKAVLRRYHMGTSSSSLQPEPPYPPHDSLNILKHKDIRIELESRITMIRGAVLTNLTPKEFELLCLFVRHPKKVFTRDMLIESIWGYDYIGEERTVDVHIKRLRNKISTPENPLVVTVWGIGYKLEE
ncbi:response regulator transcription factor [Paenibacillus periandrae]|uniref:response regulator transcription factor n=1 Tax=Paenibacillus periandrae TaxID=1761741 RepID=UPI001F09BBDF|nr:response regulator transcription factor [Paenibacillus periandrae]